MNKPAIAALKGGIFTKRNDIFMWAYISFICFCMIFRMFWTFPLWGSVVLAITISSMFFAVEDLCSSIERFLKDSCAIAENFISIARKEISKDVEFLDSVAKKAEEYNDTEHNISDVNTSFDPIRNAMTQLNELADSVEKQISEKRKLQRQCQKYANLMAYLGFLFLFCVLILSSADVVPAVDQEFMTVLAFGVILVTQQINIHYEKKIKKDLTDSEAALKAQQEARRAMIRTKDRFSHLVDLVEHINQIDESGDHVSWFTTEACKNAD